MIKGEPVTSIQKDVFPNGLTVITESMPVVRSVSIGIWLRSGSRQENESENGISHFLEHMVFKGTTNRTAEEIARSADSIGGHLDAFTAKESQVIREEIKMVEDTPDDLVHEIFSQSYWRGHALGRPILGTRETVSSFDRKSLSRYFRRDYNPSNILVTAAGHLEHARIVDLAMKEFGDLPTGPPHKDGARPVPHFQVSHRRKKNLEQVHILVGAPANPQAHDKRFACYVLNTMLGGGMSSRLFQNIREKRGLVYAVFSGLSTFRDVGCLAVYAGTGTANARTVVELIMEEFRRLK